MWPAAAVLFRVSCVLPCSARFKDELLPHLENKHVDVFWADHRLAALWANSDAAKTEFPDYSYLVRAAAQQGLPVVYASRRAVHYGTVLLWPRDSLLTDISETGSFSQFGAKLGTALLKSAASAQTCCALWCCASVALFKPLLKHFRLPEQAFVCWSRCMSWRGLGRSLSRLYKAAVHAFVLVQAG